MIRINELARELEIPSKALIELLPDFGVTEKKTHSSSVEVEVAERLRVRFGKSHLSGKPYAGEARPSAAETAPVPSKEELNDTFAAEPAPASPVQAEPTPPVHAEPAQAVPARPIAPAPRPAESAAAPPAAASAPSPEAVPAEPETAKPILPLRPPVGGGGPIQPPVGGAVRPPVVPLRPPVPASSPGAPAAVQPSPGPAIPRPPVAPVSRPPAAMSGPRQPIPADAPRPSLPPPPVSAPRLPIPSARPTVPSPSMPPAAQRSATPPVAVVVAPGAPMAPPRAPAAGPGQPMPQRPAAPPPGAPRPAGLAGQPQQRPVVPANPALAARISQQSRAGAAPGAPIRPGAPMRPAAAAPSPMPGQPNFRGPIRPGQPIGPRPGVPGPGGGMGRGPMGRGRPMHPTSPLRPESPVAPPTEAGRRHATKPKTAAERKREEQEGKLLMRQRREEQVVAVNREITISEGITVKELAEKLGIKSNLVVKKLVDKKIFATINQHLDLKLAEELARDFSAVANQMSYEEEASWDVEMAESSGDQVPRAPVVTIMGHVDHGKTSLLDAIREANVAAGEAGGITQHIGAYSVAKGGKRIVFIDTPGHEAFTRMRARGAKVTDIVILVVGADDGVMPQTLEAIDHARAAKVPIIVAINKIDKPDAQPDRIKQQLADRGLLAEDWGGDTVMVPVSAKARTNLDTLLEMILLVTEMGNLKANPTRPAIGNVLEAQLDKGRGPVATVLVRNGTLKVGDFFICGSVFGKVRAMYDDRGGQIRQAEPSTPVEVLGMDQLPEIGDQFQVVVDTGKARQIVEFREQKARDIQMAKGSRVGLDVLAQAMKDGESKELNVIIKADVGGSAEVVGDTLEKLSTEKVKIRVLRTGVGAITEADVLLAAASQAVIIGFNVRPERKATEMAEKEKIDIRLHTIIYEMVDEIKRAMVGLLEPVFKETFQGRLEVREVFRITKVGTVAGCYVQEGFITRQSEVRLLRDNVVMFTGKVDALKRFKNDASEVKQGFECGVSIVNYQDIKTGDVIEAFVTEKVAQLTLQ
ncbi:MAG: translation initiation factor IF-2 [Bryobacteraceae bacterium]|nr:translation initiation factor IF-2 [Bryobacteraceae bacterium]